MLQFAVIFMKRQRQSICQRDKCNWRRLTRKSLAGTTEQSKTLDNIPVSCLKINNPDPSGECTQDRPHTAVSFSPSTPPYAPQSSFSPHYARNPKLSCVRPVLSRTPSVSLSFFSTVFFFLFLSLCLSLLIYHSPQQAGLQNTSEGYWEIAVK